MTRPPSSKRSSQYQAKERAEFFRRLDRGGMVRAVAAELGLSPSVCYRWRGQARVATPRAASRSHTDEDRAEFFRRLELVGNVSKVAKELGFVRVTCYKWAGLGGESQHPASQPPLQRKRSLSSAPSVPQASALRLPVMGREELVSRQVVRETASPGSRVRQQSPYGRAHGVPFSDACGLA